MVNTKHEVGKVDLLSVLLMQASVVAARIALFDIRNGQLINRGNLHLALGGTFEQSPEKRVVAGATEEKAGDLVSASSCSKAEITGKILQ